MVEDVWYLGHYPTADLVAELGGHHIPHRSQPVLKIGTRGQVNERPVWGTVGSVGECSQVSYRPWYLLRTSPRSCGSRRTFEMYSTDSFVLETKAGALVESFPYSPFK